MENDTKKSNAHITLRRTWQAFRPHDSAILTGMLLLALLTCSMRPLLVQAQATITVSTTADDTIPNGNCTLREALIAANTDTAVDACVAGTGSDTIILAGAIHTLTIPGSSEDAAATGDLDVTSTITIRGAGASSTIIQAGTSNPVTSACGSCVDRVFDVRGGGTLTLESTTVRHGSLTSTDGGGIRVASGSTLTLDRCAVSNNLIDAPSGEGGGIFNQGGTVTIRESTIWGNKSNQDKGGGLKNTGTGALMQLENSTVSGNIAGSASADNGGGIQTAAGATLTLINSTISGNTAGDSGGGIYATSATLVITESTISGNTADDDGGGLFLASGTYTLTNSTLSGNTANSNGGGIYDGSSTNTITLNNVTLAGNSAGDGVSAAIRVNTSGSPLTLNNSILTGNVNTNGTPASECNSATTLTGTNNLIDDASCGITHRLGAIDAMAFSATLSDNGGPTLTHAITFQDTPTDGAEDGNAAACAAAGIITDQRGLPRNGTCDVGAFEAATPPLPSTTASITIVGTAGINNDAGWRMMAPPASGLTRADLNGVTFSSSSGSGDDLLRRYDESASTPWLNTASSDALPQGQGFLLYLFDDAIDPIDPDLTISFPGATETTSSVTTPSLDTNEELHLLGNPFFTGFDLSNLNLVPQGFQATVQVWDPTAGGGTGSYRPFTQGTGEDILAKGQGFFVQRTSTSPGSTTLTFDSAGRVDGGTFVGKTHKPSSGGGQLGFVLSGQAPNGTLVHDEGATVLFRDDAIAGWDAYEIVKLVPLTDQYATVALVGEQQGAHKALAVASYPRALVHQLDIPLHLEGRSFTGPLSLSWPVWKEIPTSWQFVLVDHETGTRVDLRQAQNYTFTHEAPTGKALTARNVLAQSLQMTTSAAGHRFTLEINPLSTTAAEEAAALSTFHLSQNYPNPFHLQTTIGYTMPVAGPARLIIYDMLGREVARPLEGWSLAGTHTVPIDGSSLSSGIYVYVLEAGSQRLRQTMMRVK